MPSPIDCWLNPCGTRHVRLSHHTVLGLWRLSPLARINEWLGGAWNRLVPPISHLGRLDRAIGMVGAKEEAG